jgi:hypothetical protein
MKSIQFVDIFEPKQGHLDYVGTAAVVVKHSPLTTKEHEVTAMIRSNPGIRLCKLCEVFNMEASALDQALTAIEKKGILFGESEGTIEIIKENGVYKE